MRFIVAIHDDGVKVQFTKKLDNPFFADYLWYCTCKINGGSTTDIPPISLLIKHLENSCTTPNALALMRKYSPRDQRDFGLERWIDTLAGEFDAKCLTDKSFDWLDNKNTRIHHFIWRLMSHLGVQIDGSDQLLAKTINITLCSSFVNDNIKTHANTNKKLKSNISTLDIASTINRLPCNKTEKENLVLYISEFSESIMNSAEITTWINKQKAEKVTWLHKYLEHQNIDYVPLVLNGSSAQKDDLISFFDVLIITNIDRYKLLVSNVKKAWSQKIYRDKNIEKKQYSINMSKDIGNILDELSQMEQKNKNAIIEELIREAYAKRCAI